MTNETQKEIDSPIALILNNNEFRKSAGSKIILRTLAIRYRALEQYRILQYRILLECSAVLAN